MQDSLIHAVAALPDQLPRLNEVGVREEIMAPILRALKYSSFRENQIRRERSIRYPFRQLGRKGKKGEVPLTARPDYELEAGPNHRVVIETKSTSADISEDDVDQAYSYASHPEVKAVIYIVTNGKSFQVFHTFNANPYKPVRTISYAELKYLPETMIFLSPERVRQDFPLPKSDLGVPIIFGNVSGGIKGIGQMAFTFGENVLWGKREEMAALRTHPSDLSDCKIYRDENGRIRIHFDSISRNPFIKSFQEEIGFNTVNAVAHDKYLSVDSTSPTLFAGDYNLILQAGMEILNPEDGHAIKLPIDLMILQRFSAQVVVNGDTANFLFEGYMSTYAPDMPIGSGRYVGGGQIEFI